ncbi:MAG: ABC transporter ATP-binding protein [Anaerolineales bacterium]|nr:ABC transporter ATP-binding protein [Anaerolineales bacterium]
MIRTENLGKHFSDFVAVSGVNLSVDPGQILALLGPNGAGKTTTIRMLTCLLRPTYGAAQVAGYNIVDDPDKVRQNVGLLTEHPGVYLRMIGIDYLVFFAELYQLPVSTTRQKAIELFEQFDMIEAVDRRIGDYSKGMRQKLAIIRALLHDPPVLMLDEPTSAMDPQSAKMVRDAIIALRNDDRTILLCTHNLAEAEMLADRIAVIRRGHIIASGSPKNLKKHLLGDPLMEVQLAKTLDGLEPELTSIIEIETSGNDWFRYRTTSPEVTNPQLLRRLAGLGIDVITLSLVSQSLEEVYLQVVTGQQEVSV